MRSGLSSVLRVGLTIAGCTAVGFGGLAFRTPATSPVKGITVEPRFETADSITAEARLVNIGVVTAHDAFRHNRQASTVAYDGVRIEAARLTPPTPAAPKPALALSGILWGVEPTAIVEGVPGIEGSRLFHPGDTAGGIRLRSVTPDHVVLVGMDTTWILVIRTPAP